MRITSFTKGPAMQNNDIQFGMKSSVSFWDENMNLSIVTVEKNAKFIEMCGCSGATTLCSCHNGQLCVCNGPGVTNNARTSMSPLCSIDYGFVENESDSILFPTPNSNSACSIDFWTQQ